MINCDEYEIYDDTVESEKFSRTNIVNQKKWKLPSAATLDRKRRKTDKDKTMHVIYFTDFYCFFLRNIPRFQKYFFQAS